MSNMTEARILRVLEEKFKGRLERKGTSDILAKFLVALGFRNEGEHRRALETQLVKLETRGRIKYKRAGIQGAFLWIALPKLAPVDTVLEEEEGPEVIAQSGRRRTCSPLRAGGEFIPSVLSDDLVGPVTTRQVAPDLATDPDVQELVLEQLPRGEMLTEADLLNRCQQALVTLDPQLEDSARVASRLVKQLRVSHQIEQAEPGLYRVGTLTWEQALMRLLPVHEQVKQDLAKERATNARLIKELAQAQQAAQSVLTEEQLQKLLDRLEQAGKDLEGALKLKEEAEQRMAELETAKAELEVRLKRAESKVTNGGSSMSADTRARLQEALRTL